MTVKVAMESWLAQRNGISTELTGTIEAETAKAVLFSGHALVEPRTYCMRCERTLTHPSSKLIGYGPICCEKLGIYWPSKSELTEEELSSVRSQLEKLEWKGWLPKSRITIVGDYEVAQKVAVTKAGITQGKKIGLISQYSDKDKCQQVKEEFGGRWNTKDRFWEFPLRTEVLDRIQELWPEIELTNGLLSWQEAEEVRRASLLEAKARDDAQLNTILADTLYDYQRVGTAFLHKAGKALLGDDMGLGKTIQTIAACDEAKAQKVLVVCPNSLKNVWKKEIQKWLPEASLEVTKNKSYKGNSQFTIVNYEALRPRKSGNPLLDKLSSTEWDVLIMDEAHRVKNRKAQQTKGLKQVAKSAKRTYALTGTPIQNRPQEIWSILNIMYPEKFASFWRFVEQYCHISHNGWGMEIGPVKDPEAFRQMLAPIMLRRKKEEVLKDMPSKTIQKQLVELYPAQRKLYKQMEQDMIMAISETETVAAPVVIAQITRLKQIAVSAELLGAPAPSAKLDTLMDIIEDSGDQKIVVFSQFATAINLAAARLAEAEIGHATFTGQNVATRDAELEKFQFDPNCKVFLATIQAGGVGIALTSASIAVFLDKDWVPANNNQAIDRIHRIGQTRPVTVVELIAQDTVEEWIEELLAEKQEIFDSLIEGKATTSELWKDLARVIQEKGGRR